VAQLTGLFGLGLAILPAVALYGTLTATRIAALCPRLKRPRFQGRGA
jgi:hypothetical protein